MSEAGVHPCVRLGYTVNETVCTPVRLGYTVSEAVGTPLRLGYTVRLGYTSETGVHP